MINNIFASLNLEFIAGKIEICYILILRIKSILVIYILLCEKTLKISIIAIFFAATFFPHNWDILTQVNDSFIIRYFI